MKSMMMKTGVAAMLLFSLYSCKKNNEPTAPVAQQQTNKVSSAISAGDWENFKNKYNVVGTFDGTIRLGIWLDPVTSTKDRSFVDQFGCNSGGGICDWIVVSGSSSYNGSLTPNPNTGQIASGFANVKLSVDGNGGLILAISRLELANATRQQLDNSATFEIGSDMLVKQEIRAALSLPQGTVISEGVYNMSLDQSGSFYYVVF